MSALVWLVCNHTVVWAEGGRAWALERSGEWRALDVWTAFGGRVLLDAEVQTVVTLFGRPQRGQGVES